MTIALTIKQQSKWFRHRANVFDITLDNSYTTGGYAITANSVGLNVGIDNVIVGQAFDVTNSKVIIAAWKESTGKLMCFWSAAAGAVFGEVTNGTDLSTYIVKAIFIGR